MTRARRELVSIEATPYYHVISRCVRDEFFADSISGMSPSVLSRLVEGTGTERDLTFFLKAIEKSDEYKGMGYLPAAEYIKKINEAGDTGVLNQIGKIKSQGDDGNDNQSPLRAVIERAGETEKQQKWFDDQLNIGK